MYGRDDKCSFFSVREYLSAVDSDHSVAAVHGQLGYFFQHLLHLWNDELPGQNGLQERRNTVFLKLYLIFRLVLHL